MSEPKVYWKIKAILDGDTWYFDEGKHYFPRVKAYRRLVEFWTEHPFSKIQTRLVKRTVRQKPKKKLIGWRIRRPGGCYGTCNGEFPGGLIFALKTQALSYAKQWYPDSVIEAVMKR